MFSSRQSARELTKGVAISVVAHVFFAWLLGQAGPPRTITAPDLAPAVASNALGERAGRFDAEESSVLGTRRRTTPGLAPGLAERHPKQLAAVLRGDRPVETETSSPSTEARLEPAVRRPDARHTQPRAANSESAASPDSSATEASDGSGDAPIDEAAVESAAAATFPSVEGDGAGNQREGGGSKGGISLALIEQVIRAHHDEILECFASRHDYLAVGRKIVQTEFWLRTDGRVDRVRTVRHSTNDAVANCVENRIAEWKFPELDAPIRLGKTFVFNSEIKAKWVRPKMRVPPE